MLKRLTLSIALLFLTATLAWADIHIEAPTQPVAVGNMTLIPITGGAPDWFHEFEVSCFPYEGTQCITARTMPNELGDAGCPGVIVRMTRPGKYRIAVATKDASGTLDCAEAIITVTGEGPEPDPEPRPDPIPPPVPGELGIVVVSETQTRTAKEAAMLGALRSHFSKVGDRYFHEMVDPDLIDGTTNRTPQWLEPYLQAMTTRPVTLPVLVVLAQTPATSNTPARSSVVAVESLDCSGAEAVNLVKKYEAQP